MLCSNSNLVDKLIPQKRLYKYVCIYTRHDKRMYTSQFMVPLTRQDMDGASFLPFTQILDLRKLA